VFKHLCWTSLKNEFASQRTIEYWCATAWPKLHCTMCILSACWKQLRLSCSHARECHIFSGTNLNIRYCFYYSCSSAAKYYFFPGLRMLLTFYQAHSTWLKFQFTGWCVPDKLQRDVLQFTRYNILSTGQTLNLHVMIFEYNYEIWCI